MTDKATLDALSQLRPSLTEEEPAWGAPEPDPNSIRQMVESRKRSGLTGDNVVAHHQEQQEASATKEEEASKTESDKDPVDTPGSSTEKVDQKALAAVTQAVLAVVPKEMQAGASKHIPILLKQSADSKIMNPRQVAYLLATAHHENQFGAPNRNGDAMVEGHNNFSKRNTGPKSKRWRSKVHTNGRRVSASSKEELENKYWDSAYGGKYGNRKGNPTDGKDYRGRGHTQLTFRGNYATMSKHLSSINFSYTHEGQKWGTGGKPIDLVANPEHVSDVPEVASKVLVEGAKEGLFRRQSLGDHINDQKTNYKQARGVINADVSTNGAGIAKHAKHYQTPLEAGGAWAKVVANLQPSGPPSKVPIPRRKPARP